MKIRYQLCLAFLFFQCMGESVSYKKCERADRDYLACSLIIYQSYTLCSETATASTGTTAQKAADKFVCDANRLIGLSVCEDAKQKACGDSKK